VVSAGDCLLGDDFQDSTSMPISHSKQEWPESMSVFARKGIKNSGHLKNAVRLPKWYGAG